MCSINRRSHDCGRSQTFSNDQLFNLNLAFLYFSEYPHMFLIILGIIISRRALAREGDYEMMSVRACVHACVCA